MTHPLILTGNRLEIAARLRAGQSIEKITEIGWWRRAWTRQDVLRVGWLLTFEQAEDSKPGPKATERPARCGTREGYAAHRRAKRKPCDACQRAQDAPTVTLPPYLARVCEYIVAGCTDEEIARRMDVTRHTANRYRHRLAHLLGVPATDVAWSVETGRVCVEEAAA